MVYRVVAFGVDVEFTKSLKEAESAFKDSRGNVRLFAVAPDGSAKLLKQKA